MLNQVYIDGNEIFLSVEDDVLPIQNILNDAEGFHTFISREAMGPMGTWQCPKCKKDYSSTYTKCPKCGWPEKK